MGFSDIKWRTYRENHKQDDSVIKECAMSARYFAGRAIHQSIETQINDRICWPSERITSWKAQEAKRITDDL